MLIYFSSQASHLRNLGLDPKSFLARPTRAAVLGEYRKDDKPEPILAKISQETIAEMIGTTGQTLRTRFDPVNAMISLR